MPKIWNSINISIKDMFENNELPFIKNKFFNFMAKEHILSARY